MLKIFLISSITIILAALTNLPVNDTLTLYFRKKDLITIQVSNFSDWSSPLKEIIFYL
jgi:hypothetical protein